MDYLNILVYKKDNISATFKIHIVYSLLTAYDSFFVIRLSKAYINTKSKSTVLFIGSGKINQSMSFVYPSVHDHLNNYDDK